MMASHLLVLPLFPPLLAFFCPLLCLVVVALPTSLFFFLIYLFTCSLVSNLPPTLPLVTATPKGFPSGA